MSLTLGKCDVCDNDATWAIVVHGCNDHKGDLKYSIDRVFTNIENDYIDALRSSLHYYWSPEKLDKKLINVIIARFKENIIDMKVAAQV